MAIKSFTIAREDTLEDKLLRNNNYAFGSLTNVGWYRVAKYFVNVAGGGELKRGSRSFSKWL